MSKKNLRADFLFGNLWAFFKNPSFSRDQTQPSWQGTLGSPATPPFQGVKLNILTHNIKFMY